MPLCERLLNHARTTPDRVAFAVGADQLTYRELALRSAAVTAVLRDITGREDALLALGTANTAIFAELFAGATAGAGACAVLDPSWPVTQAHEILRRLRPDLVAVDGADTPIAEAARQLGLPLLINDNGRDPRLDAALGADPDVQLRPGPADSVFLIAFTSGTSGTPKAIHRTRESWRVSIEHSRTAFDLHADDDILIPGPLSHGLGLYALAEALCEGAGCITLPKFGAEATRRVLRTRRITRLVVVPTMLRGLAEHTDDRFEEVTCIISAGARLDPPTAERSARLFPAAHIREYYGATELGFVTYRHLAPGADPYTATGTIGREFPGVTVEILDSDRNPLPAGHIGTVYVRSPLICLGYLWGDDGTAFRTDGVRATVGDLGYVDEERRLYLAGRSGDMVITGGHNVYPREVEDALGRLDGLDHAVVLGLPDDYLGQVLTAVISGPGVAGLTQARLLEACAALLPRYKIPRRLWAVRDWPLTRSGKISHTTLEDWITHGDPRLAAIPAA